MNTHQVENTNSTCSTKQRVAVIGGGIAGAAAAHFIHKSNQFDVTLIESESRLGGSATSVFAKDGSLVDIAARIFVKNSNFGQYIHQELKVPLTRAIPKHCTLFHDLNGKEKDQFWYTLLNPRNGLQGLFMLRSSVKAASLLSKDQLGNITFGEYLEQNRLCDWRSHREGEFKLIGFFACILSMTYEQMLNCPMEFVADFIRYYSNRRHTAMNPGHFITPMFRTSSVFEALCHNFKNAILLNTKVTSIVRPSDDNTNPVHVILDDGRTLKFDKVIMACGADTALKLLDEPTKEEKDHLSPWHYRTSHVVLHDQLHDFPNLRSIGTYLVKYRKDEQGNVDYSSSDMTWRQQGLRKDSCLVSTQNPNFDIKSKHIHASFDLKTPIYDAASLNTQKTIGTINGTKNTYYCGAYFGHGNHEDAFISSMLAAKAVGVTDIKFYEPVEWAWFNK